MSSKQHRSNQNDNYEVHHTTYERKIILPVSDMLDCVKCQLAADILTMRVAQETTEIQKLIINHNFYTNFFFYESITPAQTEKMTKEDLTCDFTAIP